MLVYRARVIVYAEFSIIPRRMGALGTGAEVFGAGISIIAIDRQADTNAGLALVVVGACVVIYAHVSGHRLVCASVFASTLVFCAVVKVLAE